MQTFHVLVVDDDADVREALFEALEGDGRVLHQASNGAEALTKLHDLESERCLVLLDMLMPIMDGEQVLRVLREQGKLPALPVIVLSAARPTFAATEGARLCLNKPIDLDMLLRVVDRFCGETSEVVDASYTRLRAAAHGESEKQAANGPKSR